MKYLPLQGARAKRPPKGTIHVRKRYIKHYRAKRATWNEVISGGKRLGKPSGRCAQSWRKSGKDRRLNWRSVKYLCMTGLKGRGYLPQGIAGSGTARRYKIGSTPAAYRNIVLTSWYSRAREPGLFAPNRRGQSVTRLVVMDMGKRRYNRIELVRPAGRKKFRNMDSHGSGLAWAGQYIYMSSKSVLFMFNADDILKIRGRYVLPAVARWTVHGHGGLSSISIDRSASRDQLRGINYTKSGPTYIQTFKLAKSGLLARGHGRGTHDMAIRNRWGQRGRVVRSVGSLTIPGCQLPRRWQRRAVQLCEFVGAESSGRQEEGGFDRSIQRRQENRKVPDASEKHRVDLHRLPPWHFRQHHRKWQPVPVQHAHRADHQKG